MLLNGLRVLDMTQQDGGLCGQILADLGADVVQIEPAAGCPARQMAPFFNDIKDGEHSLVWWAYSRGKRSCVLHLDADRQALEELLARADVLITAGSMADLSHQQLDYQTLQALNPALVYVNISAFGNHGPKASWVASDLTLVASAGPLAITGDEDRPPVRVSVPQAWQHAASEALVGTLIALHERESSGQGQLVEVAAQQALTLATQGNLLAAAVNETTVERIAGGLKAGPLRIRLTYPAKDGFVSITHIFGATVGPATRRLMEYVYDEGFCDAATRDKDWVEYGLLLATGQEPIEEFERVKACVAACTATKTKAELLAAAMQRKLLLAPMTNIEDVATSEQFVARDFFRKPQGTGDSASIPYPGPFARFSATPLANTQPPPMLGQHTQAVLDEYTALPRRQLPTATAPALPLAGVKVLDFMWALAGPNATRILADYGATVIRVESSSKLDVCRTIRPFINGDELPENSAVFHTANAGKRMITVDLSNPASHALILDLVRWADVVTESFTPGTMAGFGFDFATLSQVNPQLIMLSTCLMGQTGPLANFAGYGNLAAAVAGFYNITGWPDRAPAGPFGAYTDYIAPRYNAAAVLAALAHRRRTGSGQHIDLSQAEAAMHFLSPAILDYFANQHIQERLGNRDLNFAPQGVYATNGDDVHLAITCQNDSQWQDLADLLGLSQTGRETTPQRQADHDAIDHEIQDALGTRDAREMEQRLQAAGIPAAMVQNSPELITDPQLAALEHLVPLPHQEMGQTVIEGSRIHLSRSAKHVDQSAPTFNRDMMFVLQEILDYDDARIGELLVAGIFE